MARYTIYVIELKKKAFSENRKFYSANPQFNGVLECLYVGMTSKTPEARFDQHVHKVLSKKGINISAYIVKKYGIYLRPSLYAHLSSFTTRVEAMAAERNLTLELRRQGYAVWFG